MKRMIARNSLRADLYYSEQITNIIYIRDSTSARQHQTESDVVVADRRAADATISRTQTLTVGKAVAPRRPAPIIKRQIR